MKSADEIFEEIGVINEESPYQAKRGKLEALLQSYPDFAPAHGELGAIYFHLKDKQKTLNHLEKAVQIEPDNITFQKNLGDFYYTILSRCEDALTCYLNVLEIEPLNIQANLIAANLLVALHRFDEAELLYKKILTIEPWRTDIPEILDKLEQNKRNDDLQAGRDLYQKAQTQVQADDNKAAIKTLMEIISKNPQDSLAHNDLGVLRYQCGEIEKAQEHYEKAVALDPDNINFNKNLAEYYLIVKKDIKKALELYLHILKGHPYDVETLMVAAKISEKFNQIGNAIIFYKAVIDIEPWNEEIADKIAELEDRQVEFSDSIQCQGNA